MTLLAAGFAYKEDDLLCYSAIIKYQIESLGKENTGCILPSHGSESIPAIGSIQKGSPPPCKPLLMNYHCSAMNRMYVHYEQMTRRRFRATSNGCND